jgi:hypothetical protein
MSIKSFLILTAASITLIACQSKTYQIKGTAEDVADGDTLFLTTDLQQGIPRDTILVKDGKFELSGETDSTYFCLIYSKSDETITTPLFVEPGTIKVLISKTPGASRVGGTYINDEWQRMNDSTMMIGKEINKIAAENKVIYIRETISTLDTRLTLKDFYSEDLDVEYNAIYRTEDELLEFFTEFNDISNVTSNPIHETLNKHEETNYKYFILE